MSMKLKLTGLVTYTGHATKLPGVEAAAVVRKGEIALFNDDIATRLLDGGKVTSEGDFVGYWTQVENDEPPQHNFATDEVAKTPTVPLDTDEDTTTPGKTVRRVQRPAAKTAPAKKAAPKK